ncbi:hypothetical protein B0H17DRAFT_1184998 [Mycena rosella]|uniref:Uncharacterized protein n=1 Tax=Mycena rosella TaxID=1033263 RepID=A0AAD7CTG6_MYCRO|nr:hypothetical protein B0H17DRAFT_1184998 [Mycena rosella]
MLSTSVDPKYSPEENALKMGRQPSETTEIKLCVDRRLNQREVRQGHFSDKSPMAASAADPLLRTGCSIGDRWSGRDPSGLICEVTEELGLLNSKEVVGKSPSTEAIIRQLMASGGGRKPCSLFLPLPPRPISGLRQESTAMRRTARYFAENSTHRRAGHAVKRPGSLKISSTFKFLAQHFLVIQTFSLNRQWWSLTSTRLCLRRSLPREPEYRSFRSKRWGLTACCATAPGGRGACPWSGHSLRRRVEGVFGRQRAIVTVSHSAVFLLLSPPPLPSRILLILFDRLLQPFASVGPHQRHDRRRGADTATPHPETVARRPQSARCRCPLSIGARPLVNLILIILRSPDCPFIL